MMGAQGTGKGTVAGIISEGTELNNYQREMYLEKILKNKHH